MARQRNGNRRLLGLAASALILGLAACTEVKKELGAGRNSPDEFMVVKNTPLTLPPDYTLRPPVNPGEAAPSEDAASAAKTALLGDSAPVAAKKSAAASALLDKLGAGTADPKIRQKIDADNGYISLENRSVAEQLIFWDDARADPVINPAAEAERIKKNQAAGKPLNEGLAPKIEKKKGALEKIF